MRAAILLGLGSLLVAVAPAEGARPGTAILQLTVAERNDLRDPFFVLVLARDPEATSLERIEQMIQPDASKRLMFAVDEAIADRSQPQGRRAVLGFRGGNGSFSRLDPNVMMSVSFSSTEFADAPSLIEAWGWDQSRGRYNYYSLEQVTSQTKRWFFQGTSDDLDLPPDQQGRCLECHRSGGPVMKELKFPWNNWHSPVGFQATYLLPGPDSWPVADALRRRNLRGAEELEVDFILPSLKRFNEARIVRDRRQDVDGRGLIVDARRILRPLFKPTEFNLITGRQESGMHPLSAAPAGAPSANVRPPETFFLNRDLIAGNSRIGIDGLGIEEAAAFTEESVFEVTPAEYARLVEQSGQRLGSLGGDTVFAWMTPEPAHSDCHLIDQLMHEGIVPKHFVAAVLAIDLREPLLSEARGALLRFIPESFRFDARVRPADHELVKKTVENLEAASPEADSPEALFLARLKSADAVAALRQDVARYVAELKSELQSGSATREAALKKLQNRVVDRRKAVAADPELSLIVESDLLLPIR